MSVLVLLGMLFASSFAWSQESPRAETGEHDKSAGPAGKQQITTALQRLQQAVNGKAAVHNECQNGHVEESSTITAVQGCSVTFLTRKVSTSQAGRKEVDFTIYADLADLSTPPSFAAQSFAQCRGAIYKVSSPAEPRKKLRTTRRATLQPATGNPSSEPEAEITRSDLSLFFSTASAARRAAGALERAIEVCGGKEWPDDDDLP